MTNKELAKMFGISDKTISKAMKPDEIDYKDKHRLKLAKKFIEHYNILDLLS
jgi:DNA-binding XRE family transcriptional regulator